MGCSATDCVLGNSVNYLELPEVVLDGLAEEHGGVVEACCL